MNFHYTNLISSRGIFWLTITCTLLALGSCDEWFDKNDDDDSSDVVNFEGEVFARRLDTPWEMVFAPDGRLFVTQRPGGVAIIESGAEPKPWLELDSTALEVGESGLLGITLDPDFANNRFVYLGYTYAASKGPLKLVNKLVRYRDNNGTPVFDKVLIDGIEGNYIHNSGALEFGPDGMLYWTMGDRYVPALAQEKQILNGKILRLTRDGGIPSDNPFPNSYVYSWGHRNPQGLAFQPGTNLLWSTEHGPSDEQGCCMDEINIIRAGRNYGWPLIRGNQKQDGLETPVAYSGDTTTWAPTGGIFIKQGPWEGSLVFTGLRGQALYRAVIDKSQPEIVQRVERYLHQKFGRLRNVVEGSDGRLYLAVSNQDGRGDPRDTDDVIVVMTQDAIAKEIDK
jgi:glucose/arabinose dehydrogenase